MPSLESLCCELLCGIVIYINRPTDLKSLCLVSKTISAVSTRRLYGDLVIPNDVDNKRGIHSTVEALSNSQGIQYVRTLHVGECSLETARAINRLLLALSENSILRFSYLVSQGNRFPSVSQIKYICIHQRIIRNLHPGAFFNAIPGLSGQITGRILSSITDLSFALTSSADDKNFPLTLPQIRSIDSPCWPMEMMKSSNLRKLELSFNGRGSRTSLASVFSVHPLPKLTHLRFNQCFFENHEVDLATLPNLAHLVLEDCYNIASGLVIAYGTTLKSLELSTTNRDTQTDANGRVFDHGVSHDFAHILTSFQGLETIIISAKLSEMSAKVCLDLAEAIQMQSETLKVLIFQYGWAYLSEISTAHDSLMNSIKTCHHLFQLCLDVDPVFNFQEIDELIQSLPNLTLIYLVYLRMLREDPDTLEIFMMAKRLLEEAPASSKLSMLCFRSKWWWRHLSPGHITDYSACFFRPGVRGMGGSEDGPIIETDTRLAKYLIHEPAILRKLEPWFVEELKPERWFNE